MKIAAGVGSLDSSKRDCLDTSYVTELKFKVLLVLNPMLNKHAFPARYPEASWHRAKSLAPELPTAKTAKQLIKQDDTIVEVLNAAWAWRIQQPQEVRPNVETVEDKCMEMCRLIARKGKQS